MRTLALDQSSRVTGWAVFDDGELYNYGKFSATQTDVGDRLHFIRGKVNQLINEYDSWVHVSYVKSNNRGQILYIK